VVQVVSVLRTVLVVLVVVSHDPFSNHVRIT
jgi:hypothetical protein